MNQIKILIVDDHAIVRDGLISMLQGQPNIEIIGEAESGEAAIELLEILKPNVILMDIMMGGMDGIETTRQIRLKHSDPKIIVLSMEVTEALIAKAIKAGAQAYIPKDTKKQELIEAIAKVEEGEQYFSPKISEVVFKGFYDQSIGGKDQAPEDNIKITKREVEVLRLIASGLSNRDIADQLFISIRTVDAHRNHIMQKLKLKTTAELVKYAIIHKIVELE